MSEHDRSGVPEWRWSALSLGSVIGLVALVWLVWRLRIVFLVFIAAVFLAYVLDPPVRFLARVPLGKGRTVGRRVGAGIVVLLALATFVVLAVWFVPVLWSEVNRLLAELPAYAQRVDTWLAGQAEHGGLGLPANVWTSVIDEWHAFILRSATSLSHGAMALVGSIGSLLGLLVIPVGAYYLLSDGVAVAGAFESGLPVSWRPTARTLLEATNRSLTTYVRGQTLVVVTVAGLATVLFTVLGVKNSLALGVLAGVAEAVPFIGALVVELSLAAVCWDRGIGGVAGVIAAYLALNQVNNYFISPRLMGSRLELHPFLIILAVLAGSTLGGFLGAMLALPATAVLVGVGGVLWGAGRPTPSPPPPKHKA
jgi:predicted PurR-regulated permease PerM